MDTSRPDLEADKRLTSRAQIPRGCWNGLALVMAVGLLSAGIGWLGGRDVGQQRQFLLDGSTIELLRVTYGTKHQYLTGGRWQRLLWQINVAQVREHLPDVMEMNWIDTSPRALVIWTRWSSSDSGWEGVHLEAFDDTGAKVLVDPNQSFAGTGSNEDLRPFAVRTFPRRGNTVGLRVFQNQMGVGRRLLAEFRIPNPDPGTYPRWKPVALPISVAKGEVVFRLTKFSTRLSLFGEKTPLRTDEVPWTEVGLEVMDQGARSARWRLAELTIQDATGNTWRPWPKDNGVPSAEPGFAFWGQLDPDETYRLEATFKSAGRQQTVEFLAKPIDRSSPPVPK